MKIVTLLIPFVWIKNKAISFCKRMNRKVEWRVSRGLNGEFLGIHPIFTPERKTIMDETKLKLEDAKAGDTFTHFGKTYLVIKGFYYASDIPYVRAVVISQGNGDCGQIRIFPLTCPITLDNFSEWGNYRRNEYTLKLDLNHLPDAFGEY